MKSRTFNKNKGIALLEIVIVTAVIAVGFMSIIAFLVFSRGVTFQIARNTEATSLAEEAIEAVRTIRDEKWSSVPTAGTYYPEISGTKWILSGSDPGPINNLYTRTVVIEDVLRDGNDDISGSGSLDSDTKRVIATVSWSEANQSKQVVLTTYITNFVGN